MCLWGIMCIENVCRENVHLAIGILVYMIKIMGIKSVQRCRHRRNCLRPQNWYDTIRYEYFTLRPTLRHWTPDADARSLVAIVTDAIMKWAKMAMMVVFMSQVDDIVNEICVRVKFVFLIKCWTSNFVSPKCLNGCALWMKCCSFWPWASLRHM